MKSDFQTFTLGISALKNHNVPGWHAVQCDIRAVWNAACLHNHNADRRQVRADVTSGQERQIPFTAPQFLRCTLALAHCKS